MSNYNNSEDDREKVCSVCHRTESRAGKMLDVPGGMHICMDCLQKSLDAFENSGIDLSSLGINPSMMGMPFAGMPTGTSENNSESKENAKQGAEGGKAINGQVLNADGTPAGKEEPQDPSKKNVPPKQTPPRRMPNISFINLQDLQQGFGRRQQLKRKSPNERKGPIIDPEKILPPHKLKERLDEYVVGQEKAKKIISVAVYNHYKRVLAGEAVKSEGGIDIEKSNVLMIGPTGSGKTHIVRTLAGLLDVPLAISDATSLTEAGYIGDDIESVLSKLLAAADNDVDRAEVGIVFIDEIDKIAKKNSNRGRDVSGESVQQGLLKMLEGSEIEVPVGASSKNAMVPLATLNTKNILFICGGAFPELSNIIRERLKHTTGIGFGAELKDKYDDDDDVYDNLETEDLRKFGMIPEFLGRLPVVCTLKALSSEMLVRVLKEPKNAIIKQYQKLLELDEVNLVFSDGALKAIAEKALKKESGARGLRSILEEIMLDVMYEIPKDDSIGQVTITEDYVNGTGAPVIEIRSGEKTHPVRQLTAQETAS